MTDDSPSTGRSGRGQARYDVEDEQARQGGGVVTLGNLVGEWLRRAEEQLSVYSN